MDYRNLIEQIVLDGVDAPVVVTGPPDEQFFQRFIFPFRAITDEGLLHMLVYWSIPAGATTVIKILQQLVGAAVDGEICEQTLAAIEAYPAAMVFGWAVPGIVALKLALQDARIVSHAATVKRRPKDIKFLLGWIKRAQEFK